MLEEIKAILSGFEHVNIYDGYQVIASIWQECLEEDTEIIAKPKIFTKLQENGCLIWL